MQFEIKTLGAKLTRFQESWREQCAPLTAENETVISFPVRRNEKVIDRCRVLRYFLLSRVRERSL